ncbi:hypothetical protein VPIG_00150 [Vibrio phage PWH3a-P1]|uniref:hypothetical protein n=1 Tax=Vibrio phage PWH3a-P1 TaxID=754058 RepID=UPI0002C0A7AD|nr:hypothetical protein VPIG_00150 [Vibrio phage PWH3a-P1]AGH32007.1 hypothetical protein VPIG_00150 [Vibrio phage PWH3a-P1]
MKVEVCTWREGVVEIDTEENDKRSLFSKVIFDECPVCKVYAEQDLMYAGQGSSGLAYACGHESHSSEGCETVYKYKGEDL